ncbi:MAG: FtsX-like permease family protein [Deltaproteobacteria bacterium]|nr:FtsX-like permease family protein [Deltaproteobacteria bacterium]
MRHLKILEHALSTIVRRKYKNFAVIVVYSFTIMVLASILFLSHSLKTEAANILSQAPDLIVQRTMAGRHELVPENYVEVIKGNRGVGKITPRYWGYYYDALTGSNYTILGVTGALPEMEMVEGALPSRSGECVVGEGVARARRIGVGDELILVNSQGLGQVFEVAGKFTAASDILTNDLIILGERDVIDFFGFPQGRATDITVEIRNPSEVQNIAGRIKRDLPDARPITKQEIIRTYDAVFNWRSGMMLTIFSAALVSFCILAWDKATGLSGEEKSEIGILKAIGWDTSDILELKFWEGLVISLTSFLLGLIAAFVHVFYFGATILAPVIKGWSVLFPSFKLIPFVNLYQVFVIGFLTVIPYIASTVIPSWKAAIADPESVMRS